MIAPFVRQVVAVGAAAFATWFAMMDANPSLYVFDKLIADDKRLGEQFLGKNVWVVGASSGIGEETSRQLLHHGANVILSSRGSGRLEAVAKSLSSETPEGSKRISVVPIDMTGSARDFKRAVDEVERIVGSGNLDCIILNAGQGQLCPAKDTDPETTKELFKVNTLAPITLTQTLLKIGLLDESRGKHLVITSSVGAKFGVPLSSSYASSKHALHGYYNSLQAECPWLRIDLICPGPVDTAFHNNHQAVREKGKKPQPQPEESVKELKMPVKRCSELLVSSLLMPRGNERWISEHPTLIALYINQFFPGIFQRILQKVGPLRVDAWKAGKNLYDPETWKQSGKGDKKA